MATSDLNGTVRSDCEEIAVDLYMLFLYKGPRSVVVGMLVCLIHQTVAFKAYNRRNCKHE